MKKLYVVIIILSGAMSLAGAACAEIPDMGNINVKDFGAKGDGNTDDTAAIKAAFTALGERNMSSRPPKELGGLGYSVFPEIIFPAGRYSISDTIDITGTVIRGMGYAAIIQSNPEKDIFYCSNAWRMTITGLTFIGGKNQLNLGNNNTDTGMVTVDDCRFYYAGGVSAIMREKSLSTAFIVENCVFAYNRQTLISHCDHTVLRDSWITTGDTMHKQAAIENRGWFMNIENILGVPIATGIDQRWIDNYGHKLTVKAFRFGAEFGGFTAVVNFRKYKNEAGGTWIIIEDSFANCLNNNKRLCAVYLEEVPNQVVVRDCVLSGMPAVKVSPELDLKTYFDGARPGMLRFDIADNLGEFNEALPEEMIQAARNRQPAPLEGQLHASETKAALAKAIAQVKAMKKDATLGEAYGHRQKTDPSEYVEFTPENSNWDLSDFMDASSTRNSEYLAMAQAGGNILFLRRIKAKWPHVIVRGVEIDLDKTPWLTWKQKDTGVPAGFAVKLIHKKSGNLAILTEQHRGSEFFKYYAYDLRKKFKLEGGIHTFDIKFYPLGLELHALSDTQTKASSHIEPGGYQVLDFLRAERE